VVYLFGGEESKAKNSRSHTSTWNAENTASLYLFGNPESKILSLVLRFVLLRIAGLVEVHKGSPRPPYIGQRTRSVPRLLVGYDQET
jgi:hypothetical protein